MPLCIPQEPSNQDAVFNLQCALGAAFESIHWSHLPILMAYINREFTWDDLTQNAQAPPLMHDDDLDSQFYCITLKRQDTLLTQWFPPHRAPMSVVQYFVKILKLDNNKRLESFLHFGYQSALQIRQELRCFYSFYEQYQLNSLLLC